MFGSSNPPFLESNTFSAALDSFSTQEIDLHESFGFQFYTDSNSSNDSTEDHPYRSFTSSTPFTISVNFPHSGW